MAVRTSTTLRHTALNTIETTLGTSPVLRIYTGAPPGSLGGTAGTLLASITCPSDWLENAGATTAGVKGLLGAWQVNAAATGIAGYFRLETSGSTVHLDGTVTVTGGGGDLQLDNTSLASGQQVTITAFSFTL